MSPEPVDAEYAAGERDYFRGRVERNLGVADLDALAMRAAMGDALEAARWATGADGADPAIVALLRTAGQLGVVQLESLRGRAIEVPLRQDMIMVPLGLPPEGFAAGNWADAMFAATAAGDAAAALRLARVDQPLTPSGPAGYAELAAALGSVWTGDGQVGRHLIASLERTDPAALADADAEAALDLVVPADALFETIVSEDRNPAAINEALADGARRFTDFWGDTTPERFLSVPLSALCVLARALRIDIGVSCPALPPAVINQPAPSILGCAACAEPYDPAQSRCAWCDLDLTADAPLEMDLSEWLAAPRTPCPTCASPTHAEAVRCWFCGSTLTR